MVLNNEVKNYIDRSVLCWLATVSAEGLPNVSPKEIFTHFDDNSIIIANIASPNSVKNIKSNSNVCVSFVDVLIQKGFKVHGLASIRTTEDIEYPSMEGRLTQMTEGKFPFASLTHISILTVKPILAPRYHFFPQTTEKQQIENARKTYGF